MKNVRKLCMIMGLFAIISSQHVFGIHLRSNQQRLPCPILVDVSAQIANPWHQVSSLLNVLNAQYATEGINSTTLSLTSAYNDRLIAPIIQSFADILIILGVKPEEALNASFQFNAYTVASENYSIAMLGGGDVLGALHVLNVQKKELISALAVLPDVKEKIVCCLLRKYQKKMIGSIQAYFVKDFHSAVAQHEQAQNFNDDLATYLSKTQLQ